MQNEINIDIDNVRNLAGQGDAVAQFVLGACYEEGRGMEQSQNEALVWYNKSAEQGCEQAICRLNLPIFHPSGELTDKDNAFHVAAAEGNTQLLLSLLDDGAEPESRNSEGKTALLIAAEKGHAESVFALIDHGANIEARTNSGWSILHLFVDSGNTDAALALIDRGMSIESVTCAGWRPLHIAVQNKRSETALALINKGADINVALNTGVTPLYIAAQQGQTEIVHALVDKGAELNHLEQSLGATPYDIAKFNGHSEVVQILQEAGAKSAGRDLLVKNSVVIKFLFIIISISLCLYDWDYLCVYLLLNVCRLISWLPFGIVRLVLSKKYLFGNIVDKLITTVLSYLITIWAIDVVLSEQKHDSYMFWLYVNMGLVIAATILQCIITAILLAGLEERR